MVEVSSNAVEAQQEESVNTPNGLHQRVSHHVKATLREHIQDLLSRIQSRNKQFDIIRAFGILAIIWGHNYQPPFIFFPVFYALPLFFFVSGYFFTPQLTIKNKFMYFLKKTRKQLLPYFVLNIFFGLLTMGLRPIGINHGVDISFESMFLSPFGRGDQFVLYLAAWFLFNLYFISVFAGLVFQRSNKINIGICICAIVLMCIALMFTYNNPEVSMWMTFLSRSIFGFAFFGIGYIFHVYEPKIQQFIVKPINVVLLFILFDVLSKNFGDVNYDILFGNVHNEIVIVPIIATMCIIFMVYIVAYHLKNILSPHSFVYLMGQHTFAIMVWHLTCFFLLNFILYKLSLVNYADLSNVYHKYNIEKLWLVYQLPAVVLPILLLEIYYLIKQKLLSLFKISKVSPITEALQPVPVTGNQPAQQPT